MSESSDTQRKLTDTTKELENKFGQRFLVRNHMHILQKDLLKSYEIITTITNSVLQIVHLCGNKSTLVPFEDKVCYVLK